MKRPVSVYSLAIRPDSAICLLVKEIKIRLRKMVRQHFGSANSEAHISLYEFVATDLDYRGILHALKTELARLHPFEINFSKFDEFRHSKTFVISLSTKSSENIIRHCEQIGPVFKNLKKSKQSLKFRGSSYKKPHMTVARKLTSELLELFKRLYTSFEGKFLCNEFVIRKFNPNTGQYEVIDSLPLHGKSDGPGVQLTLF